MKRPKRKAIPAALKLSVRASQEFCCAGCGIRLDDKTEYDHRPGIWERPLNANGTDYDPPQLDPRFIEAMHAECHLQRTVGRVPGALKTATTAGSDANRRAKENRRNRPAKFKAKIKSRGFDKTRRKKFNGTVEVRK